MKNAASESKVIPVTELKYIPTGLKDCNGGELEVAPAYGDMAEGAHGTFVKMPAGFVSEVHTHSQDYYAVVIAGVMVNSKVGATTCRCRSARFGFRRAASRT